MLARLQVTLKHDIMTCGKKNNRLHYFFQMAITDLILIVHVSINYHWKDNFMSFSDHTFNLM